MKKILTITALFVLVLASTVSAAGVADIEITGVTPDTVILPGDSFNLRIMLENKGTESATEASYEIIAGSAITGYSLGKNQIGGILAGGSKTIEIPLAVTSTASTGPHKITLKLWYSNAATSPIQKTFTVGVGTDIDTHLESITFDPELVEPGKTVKVTATVKNVGPNSANQVFAKFDSNSTYVNPVLAGAEDFVKVLNPDQSAAFEFSVSIDSSAETKTYEATIKLDYEDIGGASDTKTFDIGLPVSGTPQIEVLNTEMDDAEFKVEMENLGTAKAKAIKVKLVQGGEIMGVKIDNELKPDKHSTLRYKVFAPGPGKLELQYLDDENKVYEESIDVEVPIVKKEAIGKGTIFLLVLVILEGIYIYRLRKKSK